jgi:hypothetical protein
LSVPEDELYDLIAFAVKTNRYFGGIYKRAYRVLVEELTLFLRGY